MKEKKIFKEIRSEKKMKIVNHGSRILKESTHSNSMPEQLIIKLIITNNKKVFPWSHNGKASAYQCRRLQFSLVWEDATHPGETEPMYHNC